MSILCSSAYGGTVELEIGKSRRESTFKEVAHFIKVKIKKRRQIQK